MRASPFAFANVVVAVVAAAFAAPAQAASNACTDDAGCTAPAVCRLSELICVREANDAASLVAAIDAANVDAARDVIVIGAANPDGTEGETHIDLDTAVANDVDFGPVALPVVSTPITIEGNVTALSVLDANADVRMFLVRPDPVLDAQPDLTLKTLTVLDARPGPNTAGDVVGGGCAHVTNVATTAGGLLSSFHADNVRFSSSGDDSAVGDAVLSFAGGDAILVSCTFDGNHGTVASSIVSAATLLHVTGGDFSDNSSDGAGAVSVSTDATFDGVTFAGNNGGVAGAVVATGGALRISGGAFRGNHSDTGAGAVSTSTDAVIVGQTEFADNNGVVGCVDATSLTASLQMNTANVHDNDGDVTGGVRSVSDTTLGNDEFDDNTAHSGDATGGAVLARNLHVQGGFYRRNFAPAGGGAVATLDVPASDQVHIAAALFDGNSTDGVGGAVLHVGAPLAVDDVTFVNNAADAGGGALYVKDLVERNGADPDAVISANIFRNNIARPDIGLTAADVGLDELGADKGTFDLSVLGVGSAIALDGAGSVIINGNCIMGNGASSVAGLNGGGADASGNWWGAGDGPAPAGRGDAVATSATLSAATFADTPPELCANAPSGTYPTLFVHATLSPPGAGTADVETDYHLIDRDRGTEVLRVAAGDIVPDLRVGLLRLDVVGVNDADTEGVETFTLALDACDSSDCSYRVLPSTTATYSITDNGDGVVGEGEGEGEDCAEQIDVSTTNLLLPNTGSASSSSVKVTNNSPCTVQLFAPFVQKGASQGFSVDPILQKNLLLDAGGSVVAVVRYAPPDESGAAATEAPSGTLQLESSRGTLLKVNLGLVDNCACTTSSTSALPAEAALLAAMSALFLRRRRQRRPS